MLRYQGFSYTLGTLLGIAAAFEVVVIGAVSVFIQISLISVAWICLTTNNSSTCNSTGYSCKPSNSNIQVVFVCSNVCLMGEMARNFSAHEALCKSFRVPVDHQWESLQSIPLPLLAKSQPLRTVCLNRMQITFYFTVNTVHNFFAPKTGGVFPSWVEVTLTYNAIQVMIMWN